MVRVKLKIKIEDERMLKTVFRAVSPENKSAPKDVIINSWIDGDALLTEIESENLQRLISTLDDLLDSIILSKRCISVIEE